MSTAFTDDDIERIIAELTTDFEESCDHYYDVLVDRKSNRSIKELSKRNLRGSKLYSFQSEFAWILHNIKTGPLCFIEDEIKKAYELIGVIKSTS